ncbi:MAG TPA: hypothetical protein IAA39_09190 [Candidatus Olsenella avistercoris]|nr:hypothetical protein [Candidatus Olsenella avistercoris]
MTSITPAAREYFRAFFDHNRARFAAALALTVLDIPSALIGSWLLGEIIDVISTGDLGRLQVLLAFGIVFTVVAFAISVGMYRAKSDFVCRALVNYKSLAFRRLSEKSIRAFSRENTGSYLSLLTNDVASIEEGYLKRSFILIYHVALRRHARDDALLQCAADAGGRGTLAAAARGVRAHGPRAHRPRACRVRPQRGLRLRAARPLGRVLRHQELQGRGAGAWPF